MTVTSHSAGDGRGWRAAEERLAHFIKVLTGDRMGIRCWSRNLQEGRVPWGRAVQGEEAAITVAQRQEPPRELGH